MTKVVCPGGRVLRVQYLRQQSEIAGGASRQISSEFEDQPGAVFRVLGGTITADATCLLTMDSLLAGTRAVPLDPVNAATACGAAERRRLSDLRGRPVVHCWPLAGFGRDARVVLLEFERRGSNALAGLALVGARVRAFWDLPAEYRGEGESVWRVDDGGVMSPEGFEILFALKSGGAWLLGVSWASTESLSLSLLVSRDGTGFEELVHGDRYVAPR